MTRHEYDAVRNLVESDLDGTRIQLVLAQDKRVDLGDGVEARMCRYLDMEGGGCAVYEARPLVCRLLGHVEWMPCPVGKVEKEAPTLDALELMREYATEERLTFEQWDERISDKYEKDHP
jgi:Fe-S-cluster containining protein